MLKIWRAADKSDREGLGTILVVFAIAFGLSLFQIIATVGENGWSTHSPLSTVVFCIAGAIYLNIAFRSVLGLETVPTPRYLAMFGTLIVCIGVMQYIAIDSFFMWLMAMPLAGDIDERFPKPPVNLIFYAIILTSIAVPGMIRLNRTFVDTIPLILSLSAGLVFVSVFSRVQRKEKESRIEAETLTTELEGANLQLAQFATQAEELATTRERNRIAREIHDSLGHYLTVVNVQLEASKVLIDKHPDKAREAIGKAQQMTQEGLQAIRQSISALRVSAVENRPISDAISDLVNANSEQGTPTAYHLIGEARTLDEKTKLTVYRVVQEGLTNARKYSEATQVDVILDFSAESKLTIRVDDNGKGTDKTDGGFGLLGIRERIGLLGGTLNLETAPDDGFRITATVPG